jgi:hypothetical protein
MSFCERQRLRATARSAKNLALQRGDAASTEKRCLFVRPLLVGSNRRREWIAGLRPETRCGVSYRSDFPQATHAAAVERVNGKFYPFELDENTLYELDHRDEAVIPEQYRISERIAS